MHPFQVNRKYFISQYMDSKRNEVWAVRQTWKKSFYHSHSQMQRGLQERRRSSPFSITLFCISTVKTCFCLHECKERWSNQLCPQSLPGISISPGWDDSATRTDPGKSSTPVWDGEESSFQQSELQGSAKGADLNEPGKTSWSDLHGFLVSHQHLN